jgi:predicted nucleic acid-binding protein
MVRIPAVVDAACLIGLERISRLDILPQILEPVFATPTVVAEFGDCPA